MSTGNAPRGGIFKAVVGMPWDLFPTQGTRRGMPIFMDGSTCCMACGRSMQSFDAHHCDSCTDARRSYRRQLRRLRKTEAWRRV